MTQVRFIFKKTGKISAATPKIRKMNCNAMLQINKQFLHHLEICKHYLLLRQSLEVTNIKKKTHLTPYEDI